MSKFYVIDAHCDTISKLVDENASLENHDGVHVSLQGLKEGCVGIQFFAAWIGPRDKYGPHLHRGLRLIKEYNSMLKAYPDVFYPVHGITERNTGKIGALLAVEGGEVLEGSLSNLHLLYSMGVRLMTLTWNFNNEIAGAAMDNNAEGLTTFGTEVVKEMNKLGMIIDVSHLSEEAFWDVIELSSQPVIASHSNAKSLCNHPRNLNDRQIEAIVSKGGVIGINFYPPFLSLQEASIASIIEHIDYIAGLAGAEGIGFGSDFDGVEYLPHGIEGPQSFPDIIEELLRLNYSEETVQKICHGNFSRVMNKIMKQ